MPNDARFCPSGAPASYEMPVPRPTPNGQYQKFMINPKAYDATIPYAASRAISSFPVARGRTAAPAATHPHAKIWNGVHGPNPPHNTDDIAMVSMPSRNPNRAP